MNRAAFFEAVRSPLFAGKLSASQVSGMEAILDEAGSRGTRLEWLAYMLATTLLETARTMQPIKEYGGKAYFTKMYDINGSRPAKARELGNLSPGDGARYPGRGYVQLTGLSNYARASRKIGVDLVTNPDAAMVPANAAKIMFVGMEEGWFTGKKLSDYINGGKADYYGARGIINGKDRAAEIATYAKQFEAALRASGYDGKPYIPVRDEKPATPPKIPVQEPVRDAPATLERKPTLSNWLAELLAAILKAFTKGGSK
jgi:putative chitinase